MISTCWPSATTGIFSPAAVTVGWPIPPTRAPASLKYRYPLTSYLSDIQVVPDANYAANNIIYASGRTDNSAFRNTENTTAGVWRWAIGQSNDWKQIDISIADNITGEQISGLKTGPEGTLYALRADNITGVPNSVLTGMSGGMNRTLDPVYAIPELMEWDVVNRTLPGRTSHLIPLRLI